MKNNKLKSLARKLKIAYDKASEVNIAILPNEDIHKMLEQGTRIKELLNYITELLDSPPFVPIESGLRRGKTVKQLWKGGI